MVTKKITLLLVVILGLTFLVMSVGNSHNNSAPNFDCISCHEGGSGNAEVKIDGIPKKYTPGQTYKMTLTITSDMQSLGENAGGFAIEASAGELIDTDKKNTQISDGILTHTQNGSALRKWTFGWKAPAQKTGADITVMAVAVNGDFSPAGDLIATEGYTIMAINQ